MKECKQSLGYMIDVLSQHAIVSDPEDNDQKEITGRWILSTGLDPVIGFIFHRYELFLRLLVYRRHRLLLETLVGNRA